MAPKKVIFERLAQARKSTFYDFIKRWQHAIQAEFNMR